MCVFFINIFDDILLLDERTNKIRYISNKTSMNYESKDIKKFEINKKKKLQLHVTVKM